MGNRSEIVPRANATKPYAPNPLLRWLYARFFARIKVDDKWQTEVRDAARRGVVVYVIRSLSFLDFLCLDFLTKRFGLPLVRFVNDLGLWILEPFGRGDRRVRLRRQIPEDEALQEVVRGNFSALLFLRRPPRVGRRAHRGEPLDTDLLRTLVETQRELDRPILLLPQTFVWSKRPPKARRSPLDLLFGTTEWPGKLRVTLQFLLNFRNALLRSGEPFDLKAFMDANPGLDDEKVADKVRYALLRRTERERAVVLGPTKKDPTRLQDELLRSPRVRRHIEREARATGKPVAKVEAQARKALNRLAARQSPTMLAILNRVLGWMWHRIYDGIEVDQAGVERIRDAAQDGSIVLLPSHKSHVDYLVLSYVLYQNAMLPPLIAAGDNLNFWPIGPVLRRGGAFFIRRSFRGRKVYAALVDAYLRKLLVQGFPVEFFIEGGRSRTGKLMPPKYGLLSMVVEAALLLRARRIYFVPVSIGYERVIEERSYVHELAGGEKSKENVGGLLRSSTVLRSKYGRLYVQFGEILSFDALLKETIDARATAGSEPGAKADDDDRGDAEPATEADELADALSLAGLTPPERRGLVRALAHRVTWQINQVTMVTPSALVATALLVHHRRGIRRSDLVGSARTLAHTLRDMGAPLAPQLLDARAALREDTLDEALELFRDARLVDENQAGEERIYRVPDERRVALEYYMNTLLHFFVPRAFVASAIMVSKGRPVSIGTLRGRVQEMSRAFKYEFMFRADAEFDENFAEALEAMLADGEIERVGERVRVTESKAGRSVPRYAAMLRTYFESYLLALRGAALLLDGPVSRKEWSKRTQALGRTMFLSGEIELRESVSKLKLDTALRSLKDRKLVRFAAEEMLEAGPALESRDSLRDLERKLAAFL
ncbi:MAG: 1-acyl-sn-glycerol-3-phosphate acyltransferase [Myxococcales bacterium]|nr:1-acyl-sn-glycerol-3-phosphate acyltransferase [Myxococcales bacterium]